MKIGELAKTADVTSKTVRFYEARGLMLEPQRKFSGYRDYSHSDVERLDFIRKAKRLNMTLGEIRDILELHDRNEPTCAHVRSLLDDKLAQVDRALRDLQQFRNEIIGLRKKAGILVDCRPSGGSICGIIEGSGAPISDVTLAWISKSVGSNE